MTTDELIAELQTQSNLGYGNLEATRYDAEFGDYIPIKKIAKKEAPKLNDKSYVPYGSQENSLSFISIY